MNRIQLACYGLITSAFILGGLLLVQTARFAEPQAQAGLAAWNADAAVATASAVTRGNSDVVFVLDNKNEMLLVYSANTSKKVMEPLATLKVGEAFAKANVGGRK